MLSQENGVCVCVCVIGKRQMAVISPKCQFFIAHWGCSNNVTGFAVIAQSSVPFILVAD